MLSSCRCTAVHVSNFHLPLPTRPSVRLRERGDSRCIWVTADKLQLLSRDQKSGIAALARSSKQLNVNATTTRRIEPWPRGPHSWKNLGFGPGNDASGWSVPLAGSEEVEFFSWVKKDMDCRAQSLVSRDTWPREEQAPCAEGKFTSPRKLSVPTGL